jgi:hypothetical protein
MAVAGPDQGSGGLVLPHEKHSRFKAEMISRRRNQSPGTGVPAGANNFGVNTASHRNQPRNWKQSKTSVSIWRGVQLALIVWFPKEGSYFGGGEKSCWPLTVPAVRNRR